MAPAPRVAALMAGASAASHSPTYSAAAPRDFSSAASAGAPRHGTVTTRAVRPETVKLRAASSSAAAIWRSASDRSPSREATATVSSFPERERRFRS